MTPDRLQQKTGLRNTLWMICSIILLFCCSLFLSDCASTAPDKPLMAGTPSVTTTVDGTTNTSSSSIQPISVIPSQTNLTSYPGGFMSLSIATSPYAVSTLYVSYGLKKPTQALGLTPHVVSSNGTASWKWLVETDAQTGVWPLTISAVLPNGAKTSKTVQVTVTYPPISIVTSASNLSVLQNQQFELTIQTAPNVTCDLQYQLGSNQPFRSSTQQAYHAGTVSWKFTVGKNVTPGTYPLRIIATLVDGETESTQFYLTVASK
jgi:hypothetical protein